MIPRPSPNTQSTQQITQNGGQGSTSINGVQDGDEDANGNSGEPPMAPPVPFRLESTLGQHQRWVWDCAFSADSAYLVTACSDHYARLWELASQQVIRQYNGHHRGAVCVALNDFSEMR